MGIEHTMFRSAKDSTEEAERLIARFNKERHSHFARSFCYAFPSGQSYGGM